MTTPFEGEPIRVGPPYEPGSAAEPVDKLSDLVAFLKREFPGEYNEANSIFPEVQRLFTLQSKWLNQALEEQEREEETEAPRLVGRAAPAVKVAVQTYNATIVGRLTALAAIATVGLVSGSPAFMWPLVVLGVGGITVDNLIALLVKKMERRPEGYGDFIQPARDFSARGFGPLGDMECLKPSLSPLPVERPGSF